MRAVEFAAFGGPEVLREVERPKPVPGPGEVLVRVAFAGVNFAETMVRAGAPFGPVTFPEIMGSEVSGVVEALGPGVTAPAVGTRVTAPLLRDGGHWYKGGYAEFAVAQAAYAVPLPAGLDPAQSLALLSQGITAYLLLHDAAPVRAGETVLVHAAAGGIGSLAVQLARRFGAGKVIGTVGGADKCAFVRELGADLAIDYDQPGWTDAVLAATGGKGADLILDSVGGQISAASFACMAPGGRLVAFGISSGGFPQLGPAEWSRLLMQNQSLIGFGSFSWIADPKAAHALLDELFRIAASGELRIETVEFPLADAAAAHRAIEARATRGKVVLRV